MAMIEFRPHSIVALMDNRGRRCAESNDLQIVIFTFLSTDHQAGGERRPTVQPLPEYVMLYASSWLGPFELSAGSMAPDTI